MQQVGDLAVGAGEERDQCLVFSRAIVAGVQADQRRVQVGQDLVMQHAPRLLVDDLGLGHVLALEAHQAARHLRAGLGVDQPFAGDGGDLHLFLVYSPPPRFSPSSSTPFKPRSLHRGMAHRAPA